MESSDVLILASGSPRRRDLLKDLELRFQVLPALGDGPASSADPAIRVMGHARHKAEEVAALHPGRWVLGADTLVHASGRFLPKPSDREDAASMIRHLVAVGTHQVWTGSCLIGPDGTLWERADASEVRFDAIPETALQTYLDGQEWCDKAGAYAIQGWAGGYAQVLDGALDNVVGLSKHAVLALFQSAALPPDAFRR
ncbi:MAG: nucleoside triphosphate pyrophosphatase [Planctomycetota bacterium]